MQRQITQARSDPTAVDLLEQFVATDTYAELDCEQQCHIQEALEHLLECERKTVPYLGKPPGTDDHEAAAEEIRSVQLGEFADATDQN